MPFQLSCLPALLLSSVALAEPILATRPLATITGASRTITAIAAVPTSPDSLWVGVQGGRVFRYIISSEQLLGPIATIPTNTGSEHGLLSIVFHPGYATNGRVYVYRTTTTAPINNIVTEFTCDPANPDTIPLATARHIITIGNVGIHNGGWMDFDASGKLLISVGEGGTAALSQDLSSLRGKILRIDVDRDDFPADATRNYGIPADNPFASTAGLDEILHLGVRNPWRCSLDRETGDLWIADVGSGDAGEINRLPGGIAGGVNMDWPCYEGWAVRGSCGASPPLNFPPVARVGREFSSAALTGGFVYRGTEMPRSRGRYFFADAFATPLFTLTDGRPGFRPTGRTAVGDASGGLTTFGQDATGELYAGSSRGVLVQIICGADYNRDRFVDFFDYLDFVTQFLDGTGLAADVNGDRFVDAFDYADYVEAFELGC